METIRTTCPYCKSQTGFTLPENYAPSYTRCAECGHKFIVERLAEGFQVFTKEDAPCCSDPDCVALEMGEVTKSRFRPDQYPVDSCVKVTMPGATVTFT